MMKFTINEDLVMTESNSGMQLQMVTDETPDDELPWIEGWFDLPNGNCVTQKFIILETGRPTYQLANAALSFWGLEVLNATVGATQMSPEFTNRYLLTAILQQHRARWN